jgi:hypothetical protein
MPVLLADYADRGVKPLPDSEYAGLPRGLSYLYASDAALRDPARTAALADYVAHWMAAIVTTSAAAAARNFGLSQHPVHAERYDRAREYLDVVGRLWDSFEDDAVLANAASGLFADSEKIHQINHVGRYFRIAGPLNIARSPQGRPVYVQAGASDDGRSFAAQFAEAIFTAHQTLPRAQELRRYQAPGAGTRPQPGPRKNPAGHQPLHRLHRGGGAEARSRIQRSYPTGIFARPVAPDDRHRPLRPRS